MRYKWSTSCLDTLTQKPPHGAKYLDLTESLCINVLVSWSGSSPGCRAAGRWWKWSVWAWSPTWRLCGCSRSTWTGTVLVWLTLCCCVSTRRSTPPVSATNLTLLHCWTASACWGLTSTAPAEEDSSPSMGRGSWFATQSSTWPVSRRCGVIFFLSQLNVTEHVLMSDLVSQSVRWYVCELEKTIISVCSGFGIEAATSPHTGVWVGDNKICAIGTTTQLLFFCSFPKLLVQVCLFVQCFTSHSSPHSWLTSAVRFVRFHDLLLNCSLRLCSHVSKTGRGNAPVRTPDSGVFPH